MHLIEVKSVAVPTQTSHENAFQAPVTFRWRASSSSQRLAHKIGKNRIRQGQSRWKAQ